MAAYYGAVSSVMTIPIIVNEKNSSTKKLRSSSEEFFVSRPHHICTSMPSMCLCGSATEADGSQLGSVFEAVCDPGQPKTSVKTHQCHEYSVKSISIHPVDKNYFISADTKGFMNLWDLRKLQKKPVIAVHHHKSGHTICFVLSPVSGNSVLHYLLTQYGNCF
ncbi:WD repeat-containing protein 76 [Caerostris extrusa]|uniref:WD repeat-containing protein 76 n=1 Tax=Caerostris extrusa TaxID=172846 RepID=A0AAV4YGL3_CAEEX|nr:WD repeat-containing protein 76 [Caerostris extrusa]